MVMTTSTTPSRSNASPSTSIIYQYPIVFLFFLGTIGIALLGLPKVSSFSPSSAHSKANHKCGRSSVVQSWFLMGAATTDSEVTSSTRSLMEAQAGGNSSNRRRRKQRIRNSEEASEQQNNNSAYSISSINNAPQELPDPLVPFDSVESVRLVDSSSDKAVLVELVLRSENGEVDEKTTQTIDPRELHQTSDFDLWMALRKHIVDVSASQLSVVLGTNYFTTRDKLLEDKIKARIGGSNCDGGEDLGSEDFLENEPILLDDDSDEEAKSSPRSNSKACAWGIKMEPLAFAQYSDLIEATNDPDDDENEEMPRNGVEETGMYLLKHVDPTSKRTYVFGASPDGMITEHRLKPESDVPQESVGLLEIKSLWGRRNKKSLPNFDHCPSRFYDQIQGQLAICNKEWCDLMLFIPPGDGSGGGGKKKKRKGKSAKKRKKQAAAAAAAKNNRKANGKNYSIVRVKRNEKYWNETVLPALIEFCDEVEAGVAEAKANKTSTEAAVAE